MICGVIKCHFSSQRQEDRVLLELISLVASNTAAAHERLTLSGFTITVLNGKNEAF